MTDKEISEYLNKQSIKTPQNLNYYPELVFVTRKKYKNRKIREKDSSWVIDRIKPYLKLN